MKKIKVPFFIPWINKSDIQTVEKAMKGRWLTNGPYLLKFEEKMKKFLDSNFVLGVSSATHALHLAVRALNLCPGDEVIIPTFTFVATANAVSYCGAKPIFADVEKNSFNLSVNDFQKKITKKTKAVITVHYGGQACDMSEILEISQKKNLHVIEDCAHSLGAKYKNQFCGSIGEIGCFSFYPTKIITTGEGGMITTNKLRLYNKMKLLRSQALSISATDRERKSTWRYDVTDLGYNYRLDELRSALGFSQMKRIGIANKMRIKIAQKYNTLLKGIEGITIPQIMPERNHVFHLYTIKLEKNYHLTRDELFKKLANSGIGTSVQYYPLHLMSYYKKLKQKNDLRNAMELKDQVLSLPIFPNMREKQIEYVVSQLI